MFALPPCLFKEEIGENSKTGKPDQKGCPFFGDIVI
jgi:hypothetical protein